MKKFEIVWYDQHSVIKTDYVEALNPEEAVRKAYQLYPVDETPGPLLVANEVKG